MFLSHKVTFCDAKITHVYEILQACQVTRSVYKVTYYVPFYCTYLKATSSGGQITHFRFWVEAHKVVISGGRVTFL